MQQALFSMDTRAVIVYTDGGCDPNPGPGGWGAILCLPESEVVLYGNASQTTNNRMELEAAVAALAYLGGRYERCQVDLHTDSQYLRQGITAWIDGWFARGWRTKSGQPVKNQDLWRRLYHLTHALEVRWHWVKGHAGDPLNERVDRLASRARSQLIDPERPPPAVSADQSAGSGKTEVTLAIGVSCLGPKGPGGWAALVHNGRERKVLQGRAEQTTSNVLFLQAATAGLREIASPCTVAIYAPSMYLIQGASEWVHGWVQRGWRTKSGSPVKNRALWEALLQAAHKHRVSWYTDKGDDVPSKDLNEVKRVANRKVAPG